MILARVTGTVVATRKNRALEGFRLLLVHPVDLEDRLTGVSFIAVDLVDAGVGERVLVLDDGGAARIAIPNEKLPIRHVVMGVVDQVEVASEYTR